MSYFGDASAMYGGLNDMDALIYGVPRPETLMQMQQRSDNIMSWSQHLTDAGKVFMQGAADLFEKYNGEDVLRASRAALRRAGSIFQRNEVQPLTSLDAVQTAPPVMQRWIMAQPDVRRTFHEQRCDGYSGSYVDMFPTDVGTAHYDYRRVMQGVIQPEEEEDGEYKCSTYFDEILPGDRELSTIEKADVLVTWDEVLHHLRGGRDDPTSPFGGSL